MSVAEKSLDDMRVEAWVGRYMRQGDFEEAKKLYEQQEISFHDKILVLNAEAIHTYDKLREAEATFKPRAWVISGKAHDANLFIAEGQEGDLCDFSHLIFRHEIKFPLLRGVRIRKLTLDGVQTMKLSYSQTVIEVLEIKNDLATVSILQTLPIDTIHTLILNHASVSGAPLDLTASQLLRISQLSHFVAVARLDSLVIKAMGKYPQLKVVELLGISFDKKLHKGLKMKGLLDALVVTHPTLDKPLIDLLKGLSTKVLVVLQLDEIPKFEWKMLSAFKGLLQVVCGDKAGNMEVFSPPSMPKNATLDRPFESLKPSLYALNDHIQTHDEIPFP